MFKKMPFLLLVLIGILYVAEPFLPLDVEEVFYALSLTIQSGIGAVLPVIIFGLLFKTVVRLSNQAAKTIFFILALACSSSFIAIMLAQVIGRAVYSLDIELQLPEDSQALHPLWLWRLPKLVPNLYALIAGIALGSLLSWIKEDWANVCANLCESIVSKILRIFVWVLPLFIAGFVLKLKYEGVMATIIENYAFIFILIVCAHICYIGFAYFSANQFNLGSTAQSIKNMLPAAITGFSTMSSAASMPLTIEGVTKNTGNPTIAQSVIPLTVNIHMLGDCFSIPIFAFAILKSFAMGAPDFTHYIIFTAYFVIAKFSAAGVPGGLTIVLFPVLESCLGFSGEMLSLIMALNLLFDCELTSANILGNGAFALWINKLSNPQPNKAAA